MLTLDTGKTIQGVASLATSITYTIVGDEVAAGPTDAYKQLAQGQLPNSAGVLYTVPVSTSTLVKSIHLVNTSGVPITGIQLFVGGGAAANAITAAFNLGIGCFAVYAQGGWQFFNAQGQIVSTGLQGIQGIQGVASGMPGEDGQDGEGWQGPQGNQGIAGPAGQSNIPGPPGEDGNDGEGIPGPAATTAITQPAGDNTNLIATDAFVTTAVANAIAAVRYVSSSNPGASNDNTQGYAAGSYGVNSATGRAFVCRSASTNAAIWAPLAPSRYPDPIAGNWFIPSGCENVAAGAAIGISTITTLVPFILHERCTISTLGCKVTVVGSTNTQLGLYNSSSSTRKPTTLIDHTGAIVNTTRTAISGALGSNQQLEAGLYWFAVQQNDATVAYMAISTTSGFYCQAIGDATLTNLIFTGPNGNCTNAISVSMAYGTWTADITASTFTQENNNVTNAAPWLLIASIP
jgi:hypothetical protein